MKEFKDFKIEDFKERIKMPKQNLVGKRIIVTSFKVKRSTCPIHKTYRIRKISEIKWENS